MLYRKTRLMLFLSCFSLSSAYAAPQQSLTAIETAVKQHLRALINSDQDDYSISLKPLDPRLRVRACDTPLAISSNERRNHGGNTFVRVRCESPKRWQVYVQASIEAWRDVFVTTRRIRRGETIDEAAISRTTKRVAGLSSAPPLKLNNLIGMESKQLLRAGQIIASHHLVSPTLIRRNQQVVLTVEVGGVSVTMDGKALNSARAGDHLRVANNSSGKIVEGFVDELGKVIIRQ